MSDKQYRKMSGSLCTRHSAIFPIIALVIPMLNSQMFSVKNGMRGDWIHHKASAVMTAAKTGLFVELKPSLDVAGE